jgi:FMN phosphatase YigB (HAD superfamily)
MSGGDNDQLKLARAIALARKNAGLTQQELCAKANLSYSTLAKIERGAIKTPSVFTVAAIAVATNTTVEKLTGYKQNSVAPEAAKDYKTSVNGIKFVYFDVNGVLVRFFQRAFTHIAADTGAPVETIESIYWHYDDLVCRGEISIEEFNKALASRIGMDKIEWQKYYLENVDPIKEMIDTLKWANEHYKIGLLTNTMPGLVPAMINNGTLPQVDYSVVVDSSVYKTIKPEQKIFDIATEKSGVLPKEILFIDDSRQNLMAAEKIGWNVLWFDDYRPSESAARIHEWLHF